MSKSEFNDRGFYQAIDAARTAKRMNWKQVAAASGVSASTLTRLAQGKRPDVDSLAALIGWSGLSADEFVQRDQSSRPEALAQITALLSGDDRLNGEGRDALIGMVTAAYERLSRSTNGK